MTHRVVWKINRISQIHARCRETGNFPGKKKQRWSEKSENRDFEGEGGRFFKSGLLPTEEGSKMLVNCAHGQALPPTW